MSMEPAVKRQRTSSSSSSSASTTHPRNVKPANGQELDGWVYLNLTTLKEISPSKADGITPEIEARKRSIGCQYINDLCEQLNITYTPRCVAHGLFHRFYARQSFKTHPEMDVATTCVFLSIKIEEVKDITLSTVLKAEKVVRKTTMEKNSSSKGFSSTVRKNLDQEKVLVLERVLLHSIAFEICITTPFNYLNNKLKKMVCETNKKPENWEILKQLAYQFIIDSHGTTLVLQFPPHVLAVAGIYLASKFAKLELEKQNWLGERSNGETIKEPKNSKRYKIQPGDTWKEVKATKTKHWWQNLPGGYEVHRDDLLDCCTQMLQVFEKKKR